MLLVVNCSYTTKYSITRAATHLGSYRVMLLGILILVGTVVFVFLGALALTDLTPIIAGQRWHLKGVGPVTIIKVLGNGASFEKPLVKGMNVQYRTVALRNGYCTKSDIRTSGTLLPYDKAQAERDMNIPYTRPDVEELLAIMRRKKSELLPDSWKPYERPRPQAVFDDVTILSDDELLDDKEKTKTVVEAEIIYPKQFQK